MPPVSPDVIARYHALSSCQISDGLGKAGLSRAGLDGVRPLDPLAKVVGPAFTVSYLPAEEAGERRLEYLGEVAAGDVIVLAHGGRTDCSVWGGQRSVGAIQAGAAGTVVDGAYRDVPEHIELGYTVFGTAVTVVGSGQIVSPVATGEDVVVAGVPVSPGDLVVADGSGVVVVPQARIVEILELAEATAAEEARISAAVESGADFVSYRAEVRANA
jgi:4-hydroxy-4-methyl-2-oxoglutarate aldolase